MNIFSFCSLVCSTIKTELFSHVSPFLHALSNRAPCCVRSCAKGLDLIRQHGTLYCFELCCCTLYSPSMYKVGHLRIQDFQWEGLLLPGRRHLGQGHYFSMCDIPKRHQIASRGRAARNCINCVNPCVLRKKQRFRKALGRGAGALVGSGGRALLPPGSTYVLKHPLTGYPRLMSRTSRMAGMVNTMLLSGDAIRTLIPITQRRPPHFVSSVKPCLHINACSMPSTLQMDRLAHVKNCPLDTVILPSRANFHTWPCLHMLSHPKLPFAGAAYHLVNRRARSSLFRSTYVRSYPPPPVLHQAIPFSHALGRPALPYGRSGPVCAGVGYRVALRRRRACLAGGHCVGRCIDLAAAVAAAAERCRSVGAAPPGAASRPQPPRPIAGPVGENSAAY